MAPRLPDPPIPKTTSSLDDSRIPFGPSTIENIDFAITEWIKGQNIFCETTNKERMQVPVIWTSAERAFQVKNKKEIRDTSGALILPILTIERGSVSKGLATQAKGLMFPSPLPPDKAPRLEIARRINHDKTSNFKNADMKLRSGKLNFPEPYFDENAPIDFVAPKRKTANKIVYEIYSIPYPVYVEIAYNISVKAQYQEQMNQIIEPFFTRTGGSSYFLAAYNGHHYEGFIQEEFSQENNVTDMGTEERIYQTSFNINVLGYVNGDDNQEHPQVELRENAVDVKFSRENIVWDAKIPTNKKDEKREYVERGGSSGTKSTS